MRTALTREQRPHAPDVRFDLEERIPWILLDKLNFRWSVLLSINADFCDQILILQRFSTSTRFCTSAPLEIQKF